MSSFSLSSFVPFFLCLAYSAISLQEMAERERQRRELHKLTVSEILGLLKGRRVPIGANKRKDELIDRLLVGFASPLESKLSCRYQAGLDEGTLEPQVQDNCYQN